jgi:hypothetical protein
MEDHGLRELYLVKSEYKPFTFPSWDVRVIQPPTAVPLIIIFTKYDLLIDKFKNELYTVENQDMPKNEFERLVHQKAFDFCEEVCVQPLKKATDITGEDGTIKSIPYAFTSSELLPVMHQSFFSHNSDPARPSYQHTLSELVDLSQNYIDRAQWIIWSMAQIDLKIEASIQEYVSYFLISSNFSCPSVPRNRIGRKSAFFKSVIEPYETRIIQNIGRVLYPASTS